MPHGENSAPFPSFPNHFPAKIPVVFPLFPQGAVASIPVIQFLGIIDLQGKWNEKQSGQKCDYLPAPFNSMCPRSAQPFPRNGQSHLSAVGMFHSQENRANLSDYCNYFRLDQQGRERLGAGIIKTQEERELGKLHSPRDVLWDGLVGPGLSCFSSSQILQSWVKLFLFHLTAFLFCNTGERKAWREKFLTDAGKILLGRLVMNFNCHQFHP